jgi:hypothetical protein
MPANNLLWGEHPSVEGALPGMAPSSRCLIARFDVAAPDPVPSHAPPQPLAYVDLMHLPPRQLFRAQLRAHGQVAYQLDSIADLRGNLIAAGELAVDMARMSGQAHLALDLRHLGLAGDGLTLRLWLPEDAATWVHAVQVRARRH